MVNRRELIKKIVGEMKKDERIWGLAAKIAPLSLDQLLKAGLSSRLPVSAARFYAAFYRYLQIAFEHARDLNPTDKQLKRLYREFVRLKKYILEDIVEKSSVSNYNLNLLSRQGEVAARILRSMDYRVIKILFITKERALVGAPPLPIHMLFEAGTTMHPVYEAPYIPGSTLKGLLRSYIELRGLTCTVNSLNYGINQLMGSPGKIGGIIVTDALPVRATNSWKTLLEPEVTTPIYADGTASPRIEEHKASPNPVIYPAIARDVVFQFAIGVGRDVSKRCWDILNQWIREILSVGIGRKTSLSYGISSIFDTLEIGDAK